MCDENMQQRSVKESKKLMKIVNTDEEIFIYSEQLLEFQ